MKRNTRLETEQALLDLLNAELWEHCAPCCVEKHECDFPRCARHQ